MPKRPRPPPALPRLTGPQTCWREKTHEEALKAALDAGIITAADFSQQVRAHRSAPEQLVQAPTRKRKIRGGALVQAKCYTGLWEPVIAGPFKDHKEALGARAEVESGGNAGEWTSNNEGGGSHKYYRCNRHKACPVMLRAKGPKYDVGLEVLDLAHSLELNPKRRKNSPLTFEQEVEFKDHIERWAYELANTTTSSQRRRSRTASASWTTEAWRVRCLVVLCHREWWSSRP